MAAKLPMMDFQVQHRSATLTPPTVAAEDLLPQILHPRIAAGLAPLMHLQLRALEKTEFEKRLARVEWLLRRLDGRELTGVLSQIRPV